MPIADLTTLVNATAQNLSQLKGLSVAYNLLGGAPTIAGYTSLINGNNSSNFGAGAGVTFNDENVYINVLNALYQGNADAKTAFDAIVGSGATLSDKIELAYNSIVPLAARSDAGLNYLKSQAAFYEARAAELKIEGANGAALVAYAAIAKIAVDNDIGGLGDTINDLVAAVKDGSAALPEDGAVFTPLETADGTNFDADDVVVEPNKGDTFTLTTGADNFTGADKNDIFNGVVDTDAASGQTFTIVDTLDGGNGTDQLNVTFDVSAGGPSMPAANIKNIENFFFRNVDTGGTLTVDGDTLLGHQQMWNDRSTVDVAVINMATGAVGGVMGNGVAQLSDSSFGYKTAADAAVVVLAGGVKGGAGSGANAGAEDAAATTVSITSAPTAVTLNSTGAANTVNNINLGGAATALMVNAEKDITVAGAEFSGNAATTLTNWINGFAADAKITVTGAGKASLGTLEAAVKEVDASANTGGTTVTLGQAADIFTGGKGDDTVTLAAGAAGPTGAINGGEGTGDHVIITDDAQVDTAAEQGKITNFETARLAEAGAFAFDASKIAGITKIESASTGATTITSLAATQSVSVIANGASLSLTNPTFLAAGADKQTVTFDNSINKVATGVDLGSLTVTNADTLDVVSTGMNLTGTNSSSIGSLATGNGDLETVNITGDTAFSLTTGASTVDNVNAAAFTGGLTVVATGNTAAISITGGTGKNTLTGSGNADVIKGGAAADTITGGFGADTLSGMGGDDIFAFANFAVGAGTGTIVNTAPAPTLGVDNETIAVSDTADDDDETYSIVYTLNGVAGLLSGSIDEGGDLDTSIAGTVETFLASKLDAVAGITAANLAGTVVASADGQGSLTINSVTFGGTTPPAATIANGTDVTASQTITVDVDPVVGETYSITVTPANSTAVTATFTAATTNPQDVVNGLVAALNPLLAGKAVAGDVAGPNNTQFTIVDLNPDDGGFTVSGLGVTQTTYAGDTNVSVAGAVVSGYDKITDYTGDTLRFIAADNVAGVAVTAPIAGASVQIDANGKATFAAGDNTLALKITALAADNTNVANNEVVFFEDNGNTYVYGAGVDTANASADFLVELTGVAGLTKISESAVTLGDFLVA